MGKSTISMAMASSSQSVNVDQKPGTRTLDGKISSIQNPSWDPEE